MKTKPAATPLLLPDRAMHSMSIKVPLDVHRSIVAYAGRRAAEKGVRFTESDVVRAVLAEWLTTPEAKR